MEPKETQGAIWVKNFKLRASISNFLSTRNIECPSCHSHFQDDLSEIEEESLNEAIVNHVLMVKVKALREKFIAIYNPRKSLSTHPDYFLHVYQAYTGAASVSPFAPSTSNASEGRVETTGRLEPSATSTHHSTGDAA